MAIMTVRSTYALDAGTVRRLDELARRWGVSKSEALRRAIRAAAEGEEAPLAPLAALDSLQRSMRLSRREASAWEKEAAKERRAQEARRRA
jgi:predicted transcriptional regulator